MKWGCEVRTALIYKVKNVMSNGFSRCKLGFTIVAHYACE